MSRLTAFNFYFLQWVGFRLARQYEGFTGLQVAWGLFGPVMPMSGWDGRPYRPLPGCRFRLIRRLH